MTEWHKSSYSDGAANCVEVAEGTSTTSTLVRDTQNRDKGHLAFPAEEWAALLQGVRAGEL